MANLQHAPDWPVRSISKLTMAFSHTPRHSETRALLFSFKTLARHTRTLAHTRARARLPDSKPHSRALLVAQLLQPHHRGATAYLPLSQGRDAGAGGRAPYNYADFHGQVATRSWLGAYSN